MLLLSRYPNLLLPIYNKLVFIKYTLTSEVKHFSNLTSVWNSTVFPTLIPFITVLVTYFLQLVTQIRWGTYGPMFSCVLTGLLGYSIRLHSCDTPPYACWLARPSRQHKTESPQLTAICLSIQLILNITYKDQGTGNS